MNYSKNYYYLKKTNMLGLKCPNIHYIMNHFNSIVDKLMACETEAERQIIMDEEALRVQNLGSEGLASEMKATSEALDSITANAKWLVRLKAMKQHYGWSDNDIATMAEYKNAHSYRTSIRKTFPGLLKLAIQVFEKGQASAV